VNQDFRDIISALQKNDVEFLVVGAHALAAHGIVRAPGSGHLDSKDRFDADRLEEG